MSADVIPDYDWLAKYLRIPGARFLHTPSYDLAEEAIEEVCEERGIAVMYGEPGAGKTFATHRAVAAKCDMPVTWFEPDHRPTMLQLSQKLLRALGVDPPEGRKTDLIDPLLERLASPRLLVIDEAQRFGRECIDHLRYLHDQPSTDFAVVLSGGRGCMQTLSLEPQLSRRMPLRVEFTPLSPTEILELIPAYHPMYEEADPALLKRIDSEYAHGLLGYWANITKRIDRLQRRLGTQTVTDELVEIAFVKLDAVK